MSAATESSSELIADFVEEALESLRPLPSLFARYRANPANSESINAIFRAVHSVKGCAGFLGLGAVKTLAHALENTLDDVRKGKLELSEPLERALVRGFDALDVILQRAGDGEVESELSEDNAGLLDEIRRIIEASRGDVAPEERLLADLKDIVETMRGAGLPEAAAWCNRLQSLVDALGGTATTSEEATEATTSSADAVARPSHQQFRGVPCLIGEIDVSEGVSRLLALFTSIEDGTYQRETGHGFLTHAASFAAECESHGRVDLAETVRQAADDFKTLFESPLDIDAMLVSIVWDRLSPALATLLPVDASAALPDAQPATASDAATGSEPKEEAKDGPKADAVRNKGRMIRIKEDRVDEFLANVSSLFLTGELFKDVQSRMSATGEITPLVEELRQINNAFTVQSTALQRSVVALRRVAASGLLGKFPQMARNLAGQLGKRIDVRLAGEDTEIDKSLVEDLDAPLAHMIRNVVDHALETPDERVDAGKSEAGNLWLRVEQSKTHVIITIRDDGRGINPKILRAKAVEKGVLTESQAAAMNDQEAIELIFHAGFSTAKTVSDISGRGVGMDVVRTKIREHNGDIVVDSKVGEGTTFQLVIPIREAVVVIDGLLLRHAGGHFILPFEHVREIAELGHEELKPVQGSQVASFRGQTYDAVSLGRLLNLKQQAVEPVRDDKYLGVLVGCKQGDFCLLVDAVLGHRQVVVNNIKEVLPSTDRVAGVAQLGGGRLALVLSVQDIFEARLRAARMGQHRAMA